MDRQRVFTNAKWEKKVGYCRAIKAGNHVYVTGTVSVDKNGAIFGVGDPFKQAQRCFQIIESALKEVGADLSSTVRTRMYVTDISLWEEFGKAHKEFFAEFPPATTMVEVNGLIDPDFLIEIEVDAVVS